MNIIYRIEFNSFSRAAWDVSETFYRKVCRLTRKLPDIFVDITTEDEMNNQGLFRLMNGTEEQISIYGNLVIIHKDNIIQMKEDKEGVVEREFLNSVPKEKHRLIVEYILSRDSAPERKRKRKKDI